jgi:hypothetical protein
MEGNTVEKCFRPPNSVVLVMDPRTGVIPATMASRSVLATDSCVAVGTLQESDGTTKVCLERLGVAGHENLECVWLGRLAVSEQLAVVTILGDILLSLPAAGPLEVAIWTNDATEPDYILIEVDVE